jgi:hypothetical protein
MANRKVAQTKKVKPVGVSLPSDLAREGRKVAFNRGMSFSQFVSFLLARELGVAR